MAINDVFQVRMHTTLQGQQCLNVFYYFSTATGDGNCADLLPEFNTGPLTAINAMMSTAVQFVSIDAININNLGDYAELATPGAGLVSGDVESPFVASAFRFLRITRAIHNGAKRFAGVPESASVDGVTQTTAYALLTAAAGVAMADPLVGALDQYDPCIFHKTSAEGFPLAGVPHAISGVSWSHFATQNTRKIGRGR